MTILIIILTHFPTGGDFFSTLLKLLNLEPIYLDSGFTAREKGGDLKAFTRLENALNGMGGEERRAPSLPCRPVGHYWAKVCHRAFQDIPIRSAAHNLPGLRD